jgi:hypothetical protein
MIGRPGRSAVIFLDSGRPVFIIIETPAVVGVETPAKG